MEETALRPFPNSRKIYEHGTLNPDIRVPFREIALTPKKLARGHEANAPIRVYDTTGPAAERGVAEDGSFALHDIRSGLGPLKHEWIIRRGDAEEYDGRHIRPEDNGYSNEEQLLRAYDKEISRFEYYPGLRRKPLRAKSGGAATQMYYAKRGIVTPEMEFVAIRESGIGYRVLGSRGRKGPERFAISTPWSPARRFHPACYYSGICAG